MPIVLDTNILVRAALNPTGAASEALRRSALPPHVLVVSPWILQELGRVLRYPRLRNLHDLSDDLIDRVVLDLIRASVVINPPAFGEPLVVRDPDDDPVVATALSGRAEVICTTDRHFGDPQVRAFCQAYGIRIMNDAELLSLLREQEASP